MGDLKRGAKRFVGSIKKVVKDGVEGSKQIAEKLGYGAAGVQSDATKEAIAASTPPTIPEADDEELRRARRRRVASGARAGRAATILTSDDDTLG